MAAPSVAGHYPASFSASHLPSTASALHAKVPNGLRKDISTFLPMDGFKYFSYLFYCSTNDFSVFYLSFLPPVSAQKHLAKA